MAEIVLNRRRRYVLYYLRERSAPVELEDAARQVAAWEQLVPTEEVATTRTRAVYESLKRTHVPYLEAAGLVTYDSRRDRVTAHVDDPALELFLDNHPRTSVPWHLVYLVLTAVAAVFILLVRMGVSPFSELPPVLVAATVVAAFAVASFAHWYDVYRWRRRTENEPPDFLVSVEDAGIDERLERNREEGEAENEEREEG